MCRGSQFTEAPFAVGCLVHINTAIIRWSVVPHQNSPSRRRRSAAGYVCSPKALYWVPWSSRALVPDIVTSSVSADGSYSLLDAGTNIEQGTVLAGGCVICHELGATVLVSVPVYSFSLHIFTVSPYPQDTCNAACPGFGGYSLGNQTPCCAACCFPPIFLQGRDKL